MLDFEIQSIDSLKPYSCEKKKKNFKTLSSPLPSHPHAKLEKMQKNQTKANKTRKTKLRQKSKNQKNHKKITKFQKQKKHKAILRHTQKPPDSSINGALVDVNRERKMKRQGSYTHRKVWLSAKKSRPRVNLRKCAAAHTYRSESVLEVLERILLLCPRVTTKTQTPSRRKKRIKEHPEKASQHQRCPWTAVCSCHRFLRAPVQSSSFMPQKSVPKCESIQ